MLSRASASIPVDALSRPDFDVQTAATSAVLMCCLILLYLFAMRDVFSPHARKQGRGLVLFGAALVTSGLVLVLTPQLERDPFTPAASKLVQDEFGDAVSEEEVRGAMESDEPMELDNAQYLVVLGETLYLLDTEELNSLD